MNRRDLLKGASAAALLGLAPRLRAQQLGTPVPVAGSVAVLDVDGANVVVCQAAQSLVVVDSGPARPVGQLPAIHTLFNTHYHADQTGNNDKVAATGARIVAQERTKQWMSADTWIPDQDRYEKARPKEFRPTETFLTEGSMEAGPERIAYGYLPMAHTSGDMYVFFRTSNVIAAGDVASPLRDPSLDWFTGAWIGGRVDAMDILLRLSNDQTKIIPAYGPVMTKAQFQAERDMMEEVRARLWKQVREGDGPDDMLAGGVLNNLPRVWKDPRAFLYAACKGLWAHHDKLDANVV